MRRVRVSNQNMISCQSLADEINVTRGTITNRINKLGIEVTKTKIIGNNAYMHYISEKDAQRIKTIEKSERVCPMKKLNIQKYINSALGIFYSSSFYKTNLECK